MEIYHKVYLYLKYLLYAFYVLLKIKIIKSPPEIMFLVEDVIKLMITFFCIYIFWPFRKKYQIKKHDRDFGFAAGLFMLTSLKMFENFNYFPVIKELKIVKFLLEGAEIAA